MFHSRRLHNITSAGVFNTVDDLIAKLNVCSTWCLCNGFILDLEADTKAETVQLKKPLFMFLNDATCEDGAQEYTCFYWNGEGWVEFESFTTGWSKDNEGFKKFIEEHKESLLATGKPAFELGSSSITGARITYDNNHTCRFCA